MDAECWVVFRTAGAKDEINTLSYSGIEADKLSQSIACGTTPSRICSPEPIEFASNFAMTLSVTASGRNAVVRPRSIGAGQLPFRRLVPRRRASAKSRLPLWR